KARHERQPEAEEEDNLQGQAVVIEDIEPWTEPVETVQLLNEIESTFRRFMFFWRGDDAITATLWTVMTWFADDLRTAPYLGVRSPEKECGKSTLLTLIRYLSYHSMPSSNLTSAA